MKTETEAGSDAATGQGMPELLKLEGSRQMVP